MPAPSHSPAPPLLTRLAFVLPAVVALLYALGHLGWYLATPLGQVPVLDERENLALANAIANGALPAEPFYRAPGYAAILAGFRLSGVSAEALFPAALFLGALLHALNAWLVARIARAWFGRPAGLIAGLLLALNPVLVHYSTQALDAVPALTCFLAGLHSIRQSLANRETAERPHGWAVASLWWAAATLIRPNYLLVWLVLPPLAAILARGRRTSCAAAAFGGMILFIALATSENQRTGHPSFLPWQGAYNLWAANQPEAHGRYYSQRTSLPAELAAMNPARAESEWLYRQATGRDEVEIFAMNAYWRQRFIERVVGDPLGWTRQLLRKAYALLNDAEQYNNKTFAFHQQRSPWLRGNPLSWGMLLLLGAAGFARLAFERPAAAQASGAIALVCGLSILLFFVSARFRLPLVPLATICAGGALSAPFWKTWSARRRWALASILVVLAGLTFSNFDEVRSNATHVQDHALLASAAEAVGEDEIAWRESVAALRLQPTHPDATQTAVAAYFNLLLSGTASAAEEPMWRKLCEALLAQGAIGSDDLRAIAAIAFWRDGNPAAALDEWRRLGRTPNALAARLIVGDEAVRPADLNAIAPEGWRQPLAFLAARRFAISTGAASSQVDSNQVRDQLARVFRQSAPAEAQR